MLPAAACVTEIEDDGLVPVTHFSFDEEPEPTPEVSIEVIKPEPEVLKVNCVGCSTVEQMAVDHFVSAGVTDKTALAVILANLKQESRFVPDVCEGGHRTSYRGCTRGGYGLLQFTSSNRYLGLGTYASRTGQKPEDAKTQLEYMTTEIDWKNVEHLMKTPGQGIGHYMNAAYRWIRWGITGPRTAYAKQYLTRLEVAS